MSMHRKIPLQTENTDNNDGGRIDTVGDSNQDTSRIDQ